MENSCLAGLWLSSSPLMKANHMPGTMLVTGNTKINEPQILLCESSQPSWEDRPISIIILYEI